jgi:hypothetical protein
MGKIITMWIIRERREEGTFLTEEDAAWMRAFCDWMASRHAPHTLATRGKPPAQRGSKVQLKVVWRAPCL